MNKLVRFIIDRKYRFSVLESHAVLNFLSDKCYLKIKYKLYFQKNLDLKNPQTFNEKLQWLKLYDRSPLYTILVDKFAVRRHIAEKIGEEYLIPLVGGSWKSFNEIDFNALPNQFVLKCTHDSGGIVICKDKSKFDINAARDKISRSLNRNYYYHGREWPYKNVTPRIIAEKYMEDQSDKELMDYKFFCFNGEPRIILVCTNRFSNDGLQENFYDINWNLLEVQRPTHRNSKTSIDRPRNIDNMLYLARKLSENIPFVRIDFYDVNGKIYFGEITFFPASGFEEFKPQEWDLKLGEWIKLPLPNNWE